MCVNNIKSSILTRADWLGCLLRSRAWKELGVSIVCCLVSVGCGWATDPCLNQGNEIFRLAFWLLGMTPVELPLGLDMSNDLMSNTIQHWHSYGVQTVQFWKTQQFYEFKFKYTKASKKRKVECIKKLVIIYPL